ncbi:hypothetical protein TRVL_06733 [Trypanosoma vivax]|nr:hypothetical protein TRVL_06733 [Trypanosoma vivax]
MLRAVTLLVAVVLATREARGDAKAGDTHEAFGAACGAARTALAAVRHAETLPGRIQKWQSGLGGKLTVTHLGYVDAACEAGCDAAAVATKLARRCKARAHQALYGEKVAGPEIDSAAAKGMQWIDWNAQGDAEAKKTLFKVLTGDSAIENEEDKDGNDKALALTLIAL